MILSLALVTIVGVALWFGGSFKRSLAAAVRAADQIRVVAQPGWHPKGEKPVPFVIEGRKEVEGFLDTLAFKLPLGTSHCRCRGDTAIEFFNGDTELVSLSYHHGTHLRWNGGRWGTDLYLTHDAQIRLADWFKKRGYDRFHAMRQDKLAEAQRESDETKKFYSFFPDSRIESLAGKPRELAVAVFRAFSATSLRWNATGRKEHEAIDALSKVSDTDILAALPTIQRDQEALAGFARFFFFEEYDEKIPVVEREQWAIRLTKVLLENGMDHDTRPRVMRYLRRVKSPAADALLYAILDGNYPLVKSVNEHWVAEPGSLAEAAMCLAIRGVGKVKTRILTMLNGAPTEIDRAALEVGLAALGDHSYLKREHFAFDSYSVGIGAIDAIERYNGTHGLDIVVQHAFAHPGSMVSDEAIAVFERITGRTPEDPSQDRRAYWYRQDAVAWWEKNGSAFVESRRSASAKSQSR